MLNGLWPNDIHQFVYLSLGELLDLLSLINCNTCFIVYPLFSSQYRKVLRNFLLRFHKILWRNKQYESIPIDWMIAGSFRKLSNFTSFNTNNKGTSQTKVEKSPSSFLLPSPSTRSPSPRPWNYFMSSIPPPSTPSPEPAFFALSQQESERMRCVEADKSPETATLYFMERWDVFLWFISEISNNEWLFLIFLSFTPFFFCNKKVVLTNNKVV